MSIDHGKVLALAERVAGLAHMTLGKESREEREAIERELRALAQPAEAVLDRPARVAGRDFHPGQPVQQVIGRANAHYNATHDAAQGAVATVCLVGERYAHGHMVSVELQLAGEDAPAPKIGDRYYTHPQAAPAQGDGMVLVPVNATEEMRSAFAIAMGDTRILGAKEQFRIAYAKLLAAAPAQEGE